MAKLTIAFGDRHLEATGGDDALITTVLNSVPHATVKLVDKRGRPVRRPSPHQQEPLTLPADVRLVAENWGTVTLTAERLSNGSHRFVFDRLDRDALTTALGAHYALTVDPTPLPALRRSLVSRLMNRLRVKAPPGRWGN